MKTASDIPATEVLCSSMAGDQLTLPCSKTVNGTQSQLPELDSSIEEADERLLLHALHATRNGKERIIILSNDTDIFVTLMFYWQKLQEEGLKELWMKAGVGGTTRFVPVHYHATSVGTDLCQVLPAVHSLTGCDYTSKVGTKRAALKG